MKASKSYISGLLITLFSPLLGLYISIRNYSWKQRKWLLIFFVTIYGSLLTFSDEADSARYQEQVYNYIGMSFDHFLYILKHILTLNPLPGQPTDVYIHLVSYFIGGIIGLPKLFFPFVSFVFGYFYITALSKILIWDKRTPKPILFSVLVLLLIILRGVDTMQSIRTWTGMWVLFNGVFGFLQTNQKKYLWLMLAAPLIHFGYLAMAIPAYLIVFIKKLSPKIFIIVYFSSFFIHINPGGVINRLSSTGLGEQKAVYYHEGNDPIREKTTKSGLHWYARYGSRDAVYIGGNAFAFALIIGGFFNRKRMRLLEMRIFATGLMMASLANFGSFIYVFYSRTMANAVLYILAAVVILAIRGEFFNKSGPKSRLIRIMLWICTIIFIPKIAYTISNILVYTSIYIIGLPMMGWISKDLNISIHEVIGWFL